MKIIITGGGTGGHVVPGLTVADALRNHVLLYVGSNHGLEKKLASSSGIAFQPILTRALMGQGILGKLKTLFLIGLGFLQSLKIIAAFKPRLVLGTGGYVSSPVFLAAAALGIPTILMEQNVLPGRTVRFLSKKMTKVLVSFEESKAYLPGTSVVVTGTPLRSKIGTVGKEEACQRLQLSPLKPVVLLMGASQGARALNEALLGALPYIKDKPWQILHLTGKAHFDKVSEKSRQILQGSALTYVAFPFVDAMENFYGASDLIISRAGATTLSELMLAGKPSILVPYPYAADNHQEMNARWLEGHGGCHVVLEKDFSSSLFVSTLESMLSDPKTLETMGARAKQVSKPNALVDVLGVIRDVTGESV